MNPNAPGALFLSFDGLADPLGGSQILPYLVGLAERGHRIAVISLEKRERSEDERSAVRRACETAGIAWHPLRYRRWPPLVATLINLAAMRRKAIALCRRQPFRIVHCRSYVTALVGLHMKRRFGTKFLFDMRGFWADERIEAGQWRRWPLHAIYCYFKAKERDFLAKADAIVSLTEAARQELGKRDALVRVIPCCVDMQLFDPRDGRTRNEGRQLLGIGPDAAVLAYLGSLGGNYLLGEMLDFYLEFRALRPDARFLFITREDEQAIRAAASARSIPQGEVIVRSAARDAVPFLVAAGDLGIAFKRPSYSAKACSPTKLGEMLSMGIPVVANDGVGDVSTLLAGSRAGVLVSGFGRQSLADAAQAAVRLEVDSKSIRQTARQSFNLADGIDAYDRLYRELTDG